jgi:integrase
MPAVTARAKHRDWLNEIDARIANIRAEQNGEGRTLTSVQVRALAGEWYNWFTAKHLARERTPQFWEAESEAFRNDFSFDVFKATNSVDGQADPIELWEDSPKAQARVRPLIADTAETAQFLAAKNMALERASVDMFLDRVCLDLFEALQLLHRRSQGDWRPDKHPEQFPKFERTPDPSLSPWHLFERWVSEAKPAHSTVDRWRGVLIKLNEDFAERSASAITPEEAQKWAKGLVNPERSALTVRDVWVASARRVFGWAVKEKLITRNPFENVHVTVPKQRMVRDKAFDQEEIATILSAALAIPNVERKSDAARRWVPWLCAYTGARVGEITQLRGIDVLPNECAIRITPEAGTQKARKAYKVPLHEHLIEQGFLKFARASGNGPLFYNDKQGPQKTDPTNPSKQRYVKAREQLADWVRREVGVNDPNIGPNHAWRHTFKQIGRRYIPEHILDAITGHAPATVGRGYGAPTLTDMARALKKFPRYIPKRALMQAQKKRKKKGYERE